MLIAAFAVVAGCAKAPAMEEEVPTADVEVTAPAMEEAEAPAMEADAATEVEVY